MTSQSARTIVLLVAGFLFAALFVRRDKIPDPYRYTWAAGIVTLGLSLLADIAPQIAGPFALLVLIAVWYKNRGVVGGVLPSKANTQTVAPVTRTPIGGG